MAYMLTVVDANKAENEPIELEPPEEGYVYWDSVPKRNDQLVIIWAERPMLEVEVQGINRAVDAIKSMDLSRNVADDAGTPEVEK